MGHFYACLLVLGRFKPQRYRCILIGLQNSASAMQTSRTVSAPPSTTPMAFMEEWMRIVSVPVSPMAARSCCHGAVLCMSCGFSFGCFQIYPNEKGVSSLECHTTGSCLPFLPASAKHLTKNQESPESFESTNNSGLSHATSGA